VGVTPTIFIPTTANAAGEQFACAVTTLVGGATTTTCTGTTQGDILQGATITVAFPAVGGGFVTVTGTATDCVSEVNKVAEAGAELILFTALFDQREQMERLAAAVLPKLG